MAWTALEGRRRFLSARATIPSATRSTTRPGQVTEVDLGSLDKDTFQYDSNTGRMTEYKFAVGTSVVFIAKGRYDISIEWHSPTKLINSVCELLPDKHFSRGNCLWCYRRKLQPCGH